jgi:hypothetical protein
MSVNQDETLRHQSQSAKNHLKHQRFRNEKLVDRNQRQNIFQEIDFSYPHSFHPNNANRERIEENIHKWLQCALRSRTASTRHRSILENMLNQFPLMTTKIKLSNLTYEHHGGYQKPKWRLHQTKKQRNPDTMK